MHQRRFILIISVYLMLCSTVYICAQPRYTVTDLGAFNANAIAGPYVAGSENGRPARLNVETGEKLFLGDPWGHGGGATAVLSSGVAVGYLKIGSAMQDGAALWDADGHYYGLPGPLPSYASGVNESWTISGWSPSCVGGFRALRWWPGATEPECLGTSTSDSVGIDNQHRVFGTLNNQPVVWDVNGTAQALPMPGGRGSSIFNVNRHGVAVGYSLLGSKNTPWLSSLERGVTLLTMDIPLYEFSGQTPNNCEGHSLNGHGDAVGTCAPGANGVAPILWPASGGGVDLHFLADIPLIFHEVAYDINDTGHILITQQLNVVGPWRDLLLTPIPARVAECGGDVPCQCGDTVVADYTFTANLGPCAAQGTDAGLVIASGVTVHGNGYRIAGTRGGTGLLFDGVASSQVIGLHVTAFATGVKMRGGASSNVYRDAWVWDHTQQGVWLTQGASENWIWGVNSVLNGIGVGLEESDRNTIGQVAAYSNDVSLELRQADRNTTYVSGWFGDRGDAAQLFDSHQNTFYFDRFACANGHVIRLQDSDDNMTHQVSVACAVVRNEAVASR